VRILLTGRDGMLGRELAQALAPLGTLAAYDRQGLDLASPDRIVACVREFRPDVIVNAAAWTEVDRAEEEEALAHRVNATAPGILAEEAARLGARIVHYSTDYVFDGTKPGPYEEADTPNPVNAYGRTKLAGERAVQAACARHLIFRTSWLYASHGRNFLLTLLERLQREGELRVVDDQVGAPTWSREVAAATRRVLEGDMQAAGEPEPAGIFNVAASGSTSWFDYARAIAESLASHDIDVRAQRVPVTAAEYGSRTRRPPNSVFNLAKAERLLQLESRPWQGSVRACIDETLQRQRR
jgi:dTDP-4-dehydrorhamnose reductase